MAEFVRRERTAKRLVATLDSDAIVRLVAFKPTREATVNKNHLDGPCRGQKTFAWWRIHALACALLDTGCRVQELLGARVEHFDFEDLLVTVVGKGDKQRRIPFSHDLRRILYRYLEHRQRLGISPNEPLMFPVHEGGAWEQRNALRSLYALERRLGLKRFGFHRLRHTLPRSISVAEATWSGSPARLGTRKSPRRCAICTCSPRISPQVTRGFQS